MRALAASRMALLASIGLFVAAIVMLKFGGSAIGVGFWLAMTSIAGMVLSATSCVAFQMVRMISTRVPTNV